jgi:hypothetical protein
LSVAAVVVELITAAAQVLVAIAQQLDFQYQVQKL